MMELLVFLIFIVGAIIWYCRPITWRDSEGPVVDEDRPHGPTGL